MLGFKKSSGITERHLKLKVILYIRQSSDRQVRDQRWSAAAQRRAIKALMKFGWRREQIEVIDEDQGKSASGAEHRGGFQRALEMVMNGEVGAIALLVESRIGRDDADWADLLKQCRRWGVLFIVNGCVEDPLDKRGWLGLKVKGLVSEIENQDRSTMVTEAMKAKVEAGEMATLLAPGYQLNRKGRVVKDPDRRIQEALEGLFRIFDDKGSCGRTAEQMKKEGLGIPTLHRSEKGQKNKGGKKRRRRRRKVLLKPPTEPAILRILHNPIYCGQLWFPRFVSDPTKEPDSRGHYPRRPALPHETTIYPNHHEGYISPEQFQRNLQRLQAIAPTPSQRSFGDGSALLQQKVRCECRPSRKMGVGYKEKRLRDGGCCHYYHCFKGRKAGKHEWNRVPGNLLDKVVTEAVFKRYCGAFVAEVEAAVHEFRENLGTKMEEWEEELEQTTEEAREFEAQFAAAKDQPRVRERLATKWGDVLGRVETLKQRLAAGEPAELSLLDRAAFIEVQGLLDELPILFWGTSTDNFDRKRILDCIVNAVFIKETTPERIRARIAWKDGHPDTEIEILTAAYGAEVIKRLADEGKGLDEITSTVTQMGLLTRWCRPYSRNSTRELLKGYRKQRKPEVQEKLPGDESPITDEPCPGK